MRKYKPAPVPSEIVEEATTWFIEFNEGEVGQPEREAFIEWLKTSPQHIRAYLQVTAHWEESRALSKASAPSIDELVALAHEPAHANVIPMGGLRRAEKSSGRAPMSGLACDAAEQALPSHRARRYLLAASVAVAMTGAGGLYWLTYQSGVYTADIGERRTVQLADGSTVELSARSKIRVGLHEHERDVELIEGQALFRVAKDHARPFIVHSDNANVLAVGTEFDVYKHRRGTTVTVVEGRVAVFQSALPATGEGQALTLPTPSEPSSGKAPQLTHLAPLQQGSTSGSASTIVSGLQSGAVAPAKDEIFLAAGEQLTVSNSSVEITAHADVSAATAWMKKQMVFNSTPLSEVVDEFNRYNSRQLVITDSKIGETKISGEFSSANPDSLLKGLDAQRKLKIHEMPDRIEISAK